MDDLNVARIIAAVDSLKKDSSPLEGEILDALGEFLIKNEGAEKGEADDQDIR